ncbi:Tox-REase-5 domain-containing protein [Streptomyces anandii]|uniref:Tox-REase-5 domain-containing protein n=1 Tax=Streptomyces anandii TaxID=285454 RepID=UPI00379114C9
MASIGGVPEFEGAWPSGGGGRKRMPRSLSVALVLVHTLFAATVLGGVGLLLTASSYDALDGGVVALTAWAAAPGVLGWWLARRTWEGGAWVRWALIGVQAWLILGGLANLTAGSARGGVQLFLPILIIYFLLQTESREWYELPEIDRAERRAFSLSRMIRWRRGDEGQTAIEYAGMVAIVVAIVTALVVSGLGTQILGGIQTQVCKVVGAGCAAPTGGTGDTDTNAKGKNTGTGTGNTGTGNDNTGTGNGTGNTTTDGGKNNNNAPTKPDDKKPQTQSQGDKKKDDGCFSGVGAFFGCAGNQVKQVGQGLFVDGVWGDLKGIWGLVSHPVDTVKGIGDYGKQLGEDWWKNSKGARDKWSKGDYFGAVWGWGGASLKTGGTVLYDLFIGDDVAKDWKNGDKTRAVTHVIWNVGSLFIPGYDGAKVVEKFSELGKLGKLGKLGALAEKAGKAAEDAKRAAKAGDVEGADKAAKKADEAADEAEKKARQSGCVIAAPARRVPYGHGPHDDPAAPLTGSAGTGTTVLAAGASSYVILAEDGCDEEAKKEAEEAREQEREAYLAKKRAEEPGRAAKAAQNKKQWPDPKHNDTSDPRNYNPPDWAANLKNHPLGDADKGDGYWASRDRNPLPNWKNESWLRYQEQITGTARGEEYVVPYPKEGVPDVEFDGWDSGRQTYLEAKNGYNGYLSKSNPGELTPSGKAEFVTEAKRQVAAAGGKAVEWHFSNPEVAKAARRAFREEGLNIKVVYTEQKPVGGTRKPGAFG